MAQLGEGENGGLIVLALFVKRAQLLVQDREGAAARRQHRGLALYASDSVGEDADSIIEAGLRLAQHGLVVRDCTTARGVLPGFEEAFLGVDELMRHAVS